MPPLDLHKSLAGIAMLAIAAAPVGHAVAQDAKRPATSSARTAQRVSVAELLAAAVHDSPGLAIAYADRTEAKERDQAADAVDEFRIVGDVNGQDTQLDRSLASPSVALDTQQIDGEIGLQKNLSTGATITATVGTGQLHYVYPGAPVTAQAIVQDTVVGGLTATAKLTATQPLLRGAGASVARADQRTAKLVAGALSAQAEDEAAQLVHDLIVAYWELAFDIQTREVDREGEELAQRQKLVTEGVVKLGTQPTSALKIAELQVALRSETVLKDDAAIVDQSLAVRKLAGLELISAPLATSDPLEVPAANWREDDVVAAAKARGPQILQKDFAQRQADVAVDVAHDGRLPKLDFKVTGELDGLGNTTGEAVSAVGNGQAYSVTGSLSLQWDLGGSARAADRAAKAHRQRLDAERSDLEHQVEASALSAIDQLHVAAKRVEASELAVEVANEALRSELAAYQVGRTTIVLVFQRQDDVAQAKLKLARARIDAIEANVNLELMTGRILRRHGIALADSRRSS